MWPTQQGYFYQGWPGQAYASTVTPSTSQQQSNPSDWAAKAQQWAQQRQIESQYYQQQKQQQQATQWQQPHSQQQPYLPQQQQLQQQHEPMMPPGLHQHHGLTPQQQPPLPTQHQPLLPIQQPQQGHVPAQQSLLPTQHRPSVHAQQQSLLQHQQGGMPPLHTATMGQQHHQHSLLSQPGLGGVADGQGHLSAQHIHHQPSQPVAQSLEAELAKQLPNAASNSPTPLFPQRNAPPSSQALPPHAYQGRAPQSHPAAQPQPYGSPSIHQKSPLLGLGGTPDVSASLGASPRESTSTPSESLLRQSPIPDLIKPRALMGTPQQKMDPNHTPPKIPSSLEPSRYEPQGRIFRPFSPQGKRDNEREINVQERELRDHSRPRPSMEDGLYPGSDKLWEEQRQHEQLGGGGFPTSLRAQTEEMFAKQEGDHVDRHQHQQPQYGEYSGLPQHEAEFQRHRREQETEFERHWSGEESRRHDKRNMSPKDEWGLYDDGHDDEGGHDDIHASSGHLFPYEHSDRPPGASSLKSDEPTISSLRKDPTMAIPGLGGGFEDQEKDQPKSSIEPSSDVPDVKNNLRDVGTGGGGEDKEGGRGRGNISGNQANHMIQSLGKLVSQLQTLKGLTSSLELYHSLPKGDEGGGGGGEETKGAQQETATKPKESSETELSEETKRKVAALLATESDSDGEQGPGDVPRGPESRPMNEDYPPPSDEVQAREFDGTYDVKPQVYGTYANESDYPPPQHASEGQQDYPPADYREHPDHVRYQHPPPPPPRIERDGYCDRPPPAAPRDYYPRGREGYERDYRRDYPPPRDTPPPERGYDYGHHRMVPPPGPYDRGSSPPPIPRSERIYDRPPHDRDYPPHAPPPHFRGRSPPPPLAPAPMSGAYEHPVREREGSGPYYDAPGGREMSRETMGGGGGGGGGGGAMEVERMDLDHGEHPVEEAALADKVNIASKLQTIDYSHGSSSYSNLKSVDYNHGSFTGSHPHGYRDPHYPPPIDRQPTYPQTYEGYSFPPGGGAFPPGPPGNFLPSGLDAATLFAAYASQAGESKRKALPSWLREELEKMEQRRRKEMEKEARELARRGEEGDQRAAWRDELDSDQEEEERGRERERDEGRRSRRDEREMGRDRDRQQSERDLSRQKHIRSYRTSRSKSPNRSASESPPPTKRLRDEPEEDDEDRQVAMIMKIRKTLTEVLLEVTNKEVMEVAIETLEEERNPRLKFSMKSMPRPVLSGDKNVLAGLSMYDSDISDSDLDESLSKNQPLLNPKTIAEAFKDTKPSASSSLNKNSDSKETSTVGKHGSSSSHKSGSSSSKHSFSHSGSSKKEKDRSSKSSKKSSKKDSEEHHSSSKHSKSESKSSSSSASKSSKSGSKSSSDKESKSKYSSSSSSKSQSNRSPSPHRRSSSSSKQKDTAESGGSSKTRSRSPQSKSSKSSSSKSSSSGLKSASSSSSKSGSKSSHRRSTSPSSSGRKHSHHQRSRSRTRSRSRSPGRGSMSSNSAKKTPSSSRRSPPRSTKESFRQVQIRS